LCIVGPLRPALGRERAGCRAKLGSSWEDAYKTGISGISGISDSRADSGHGAPGGIGSRTPPSGR